MKFAVFLAALAAVYCSVDAKHTPPKVLLYSRNAGEFGKDNILICHVSDFHPPDITIQLMKDGVEIPNAEQTDLAFKANWHFHLTRNVPFTPVAGEKFSCRVTHGTKVTEHAWEPNM
ncbi:beta-2-microglobulin-like [Brachyistius frenatus]|uniref:beta-2-microglobulin-like n=1 Tax=Brachyistius frenatus TaxID=100188 RepID=UPI0037E85685